MSRRRFPPAPPEPSATDLGSPQSTAVDKPVERVPAASTALSLCVREVLGFPIRLLRDLPLPTSLVCSFASGPGRVVLHATAVVPSNFAHEGGEPVAATDPPEQSLAVFVGPEVTALALAAEHDRACLRAWCARKPDWRLTTIEAIGTIGARVEPRHWTTGQVLHALGLRLDEVWL
jgi:hypothetical protein